MDVLWSPWRYNYIASEKPADGCVFCSLLANSLSDRDNFIVHRAEHNFIVLNIYPYTTGHLMVVPYRHLASPFEAEKPETDEMMDLVRRSEAAIRKTYRPDGLNIGMNLGRSAGAGVADHYHMHVLPRWVGDVNFMTAIGQTRTLPETLAETYDKLSSAI